MLRFASLGSGSKGNATVVAAGDTVVLIDCGFSVRETARRLATLGLAPEQLDAILVTHEHSDHSAGVARLARRHNIPVYLTHGTLGSGRLDGCPQVHCFNCAEQFRIGSLDIEAVAVPHDAREPCQYRLSYLGRSLGVLTDLGSITEHVVARFRGVQALVLEFNHDLDMLWQGAYPAALKKRVAGDWGHLNNGQAVALLQQLGIKSLQHLVVAHISEQNNCPQQAAAELAAVYGPLDSRVVFAAQDSGFGWLALT
ncbi:MBL fold metallo-hydrolase [Kineobactrum sediminis]|uniref:MBL fold metallo-hydrolase n=1 Tax=Kineobactrum sediminis TaxID=1905677 RepID=A0A2N5Y3L8_9GAMM|nr:MBL fold metallo-hydrolase [Kineobactrum sediminis]PLW82995.1 MBL fold metallo-hydrolase [Kineobactrum sediminis]